MLGRTKWGANIFGSGVVNTGVVTKHHAGIENKTDNSQAANGLPHLKAPLFVYNFSWVNSRTRPSIAGSTGRRSIELAP